MIRRSADIISSEAECDVYVFSAQINDSTADELIEEIRQCEARKPNVVLALITDGGSADAAYRMARALKRHYKRFTLLVFGACYSAGTLVAVGADEIVMSEFGRLGPLDVQLADKSEFYGQTPALDVSQALATLSESAFNFFTSHFFSMGPGRGMNTQLASDIAKTLTLGIIEPIAKQIDPLLLGRVDRSMKIAEAYSERLNKSFRNIKTLVQGYPSHEFVIDLDEAKSIFASVREPKKEEAIFEEIMRLLSWAPYQSNPRYISRIKESTEDEQNAAAKESRDENSLQADRVDGQTPSQAMGTENSERISSEPAR